MGNKNSFKKLFPQKPIMLAPMDGFTDFALRQVFHEQAIYHPDYMFTEFINVETVIRKIKTAKRVLFTSSVITQSNKQKIGLVQSSSKSIKNISNTSVQFVGNKPDSFYLASKQVLQIGYNGIDINIGCSTPKILKNNEGAALIQNHKLVSEIVYACQKAIDEKNSKHKQNQETNTKKQSQKMLLTLKTRLGYEEEYNEKSTIEWIKFLNTLPLDWITMHGRTALQGYKREANWNAIAKMASISEIPLVGNGDIKSIQEGKKKFVSDSFGNIAGVMIARKAQCFLDDTRVARIKAVLRYLELHKDYLSKFFPSQKTAFIYCRKVISWLLSGIPNIRDLRMQLMFCEDYKRAKELLKN